MPFSRVVSTHAYCFICNSKKNISVVPCEARQQAFVKRRIFIPKGNRCCSKHLIKRRFYENDLNELRIFSHESVIEVNELQKLIEHLTINCDSSLKDHIGKFTLSDERLKVFTGIKHFTILQIVTRFIIVKTASKKLFFYLIKQRKFVYYHVSKYTFLLTNDFKCLFCLNKRSNNMFLGFTWENILELQEMLTSMRNSHTRNITQCLVTFLFRLRTGNSNAMIAAILGLENEQKVSEYCDSVVRSFEKDVLPNNFGFRAKTREDILQNETSFFAKKMLNADKKLAIILDGTYITHQKSTNNEYQRKSYSGQKKKPLCKPFTICSTNGYILETLGPFQATLNDAEILRLIMQDPQGLTSILQEGDIFIVDRGFRDVKTELEKQKFEVLMPAMKGEEKYKHVLVVISFLCAISR